MGSIIFIITIIVAFAAGVVSTLFYLRKQAKINGCPFKFACLYYDDIETKAAIKRILQLLVDNKISKPDVQSIIDNTIK